MNRLINIWKMKMLPISFLVRIKDAFNEFSILEMKSGSSIGFSAQN